MFEKVVLRRTFVRVKKKQKDGENVTVRNFIYHPLGEL